MRSITSALFLLLLLLPAVSGAEGVKNLDLRIFYWPSRVQTDVLDPESREYRKDYRKPPEITVYIPGQSGQVAEIPTRPRSGTKPTGYRGPATLPIYLSKPVADENGVLPSPHTTLDLSAYADSAFILMRVDVDTGQVQFMPVPDSAQKSPAGSYTVVNLSGQDVGVELNDSTFMLTNQSVRNVQPEGQVRYDALKVAVREPQGGVSIVSDLNLPRQKSSRYLVFLRTEPVSDKIGVDVIPF